MDIIQYLLLYIQYQHKMLYWSILFICRYTPLKQWAFDEAHSPKYQKLTIDKLPIVKKFHKQDWQVLLEYYQWLGDKPIKPIQRRNGKTIPEDTKCPLWDAPYHYLYDNNGGNGQYQCKICGQTFVTGEQVIAPYRRICPHCHHTLSPVIERKIFNKYKLHYIYREFKVEFFPMKSESLQKNASLLKLTKHTQHVMGLCLTYHVNLQLSLRKTAQALYDIHSTKISHQQVANYAKTAALVIKPLCRSL